MTPSSRASLLRASGSFQVFTDTNCNLGRFKSSHSIIQNNTFRNAKIRSLELSWLPQFFEGPVVLRNVTLADNLIEGEGSHPVHCGPFCGSQSCLYSPTTDQPTGTWNRDGCQQCPDCFDVGGETPWTTAKVSNSDLGLNRPPAVVTSACGSTSGTFMSTTSETRLSNYIRT